MEKVYLVAGGTGGHINGAIALSEVLKESSTKKYDIRFISSQRDIDHRVLKNFSSQTWHLNAQALKGKGKIETLKNIVLNAWVFTQVFIRTIFSKPKFAIGLGGFICGPSLLACRFLGVPIFIVEQNSVMGMANKLLVPFTNKVFCHFSKTINYPIKYQDKILVSGNPIRSQIKYTAPRKLENKSAANILIFGGSLGAEEINDCILKLLNEYKESDRLLNIKHQVGQGKAVSMPKVKQIEYEQIDFIDNMSEAYRWADIIICRGGASTISELAIVKKPCFIFPYPHLDQHQFHNAKMLQEANSFLVNYVQSSQGLEAKYLQLKNFISSFETFNVNAEHDKETEISASEKIISYVQGDLK